MYPKRFLFFLLSLFVICFISTPYLQAKDQVQKGPSVENVTASKVVKEAQSSTTSDESGGDDSGLITITFGSGMMLADALRTIAEDAGINLVISPEVDATISSITFKNAPWEQAIKTIVDAYGYGYEKTDDNTIVIAPLEKIIERKKKQMELNQVKEVETRVFSLKYIDAGDALKVVESLLSPRGTAEILEITYLGGWKFVASQDKGKVEKTERKEKERKSRSKKLVVTDIKSVLNKVEAVLKDIDHPSKLILIESNIVEADWHKLYDLGMEAITGPSADNATMNLGMKGDSPRETLSAILGALDVAPSYYSSPSSVTNTGVPSGGFGFIFSHLTGNNFRVALRALEELADANVLSAPKILTISNQEASILVGTKFPIVSVDKELSNGTTSIQVNLEYYQDIGVQLNVVPQICDNKYINMILHPAVVEKSGELDLGISELTTGNAVSYPIMDVREAETQVMIKSGDTVVIGGLMRDKQYENNIGVPLLSSLPVLGNLFTRRTTVNIKKDLFIFVNAKIVDPVAGKIEAVSVNSMNDILPKLSVSLPLDETGVSDDYSGDY